MVRAKFRCNSVTDYGTSTSAELGAVADDGTEENKRFNKATPSGQLKITVDNPTTRDFLKPGKYYYLDFTEAE